MNCDSSRTSKTTQAISKVMALVIIFWACTAPYTALVVAAAENEKGEAPKIRVTYPNGGEVVLMGEKLKIRWHWRGEINSKVRIELLRSNGLCTVISEATANDGKLNWIVPRHLESDGNYSVRIIALREGNLRDQSRGEFAIVGAGLPE